AERIDEFFRMQKLPESIRGMLGERVADRERAAQPLHLGGAIGPLHPFETPRRRARQQFFQRHGSSPSRARHVKKCYIALRKVEPSRSDEAPESGHVVGFCKAAAGEM